MNGQRKLLIVVLLLATAIILFLSGSMAAYNQNYGWLYNLTAKEFVLKVNDSSQNTQAFADIALEPNKQITRSLRINTAGLRTPARLDVTLTATISGTMPDGFSITLDGNAAARSGSTLTATVSIDNAQEKALFMDVVFSWDLPENTDASQYQDFSLAYAVFVEATQTLEG